MESTIITEAQSALREYAEQFWGKATDPKYDSEKMSAEYTRIHTIIKDLDDLR